MTMKLHFIEALALLLKENGLKPVREFKFLANRKFKFDLALPEYKIAVEFEGGIFVNGRHIRGAMYRKDCEKYNLALLDGWKVLRYATGHFPADAREQVIDLVANT